MTEQVLRVRSGRRLRIHPSGPIWAREGDLVELDLDCPMHEEVLGNNWLSCVAAVRSPEPGAPLARMDQSVVGRYLKAGFRISARERVPAAPKLDLPDEPPTQTTAFDPKTGGKPQPEAADLPDDPPKRRRSRSGAHVEK